MQNLGAAEVVELGVCLVAAAFHQIHSSDKLRGPFSVHQWIPLEGSVKAVYMNTTGSPTMVDSTTLRATLDKLLADQPRPEICNLGHEEAMKIFDAQHCYSTVKRLRVLNQSSYPCWRLGTYFGLLFPKQWPVAEAWQPSEAKESPIYSSASFRELLPRLAFVCLEEPLGGVLIYPSSAHFIPEDHLQVLRIAVESHRQGVVPQEAANSSLTDAEFVTQSEMRFSKRVFDFAVKLVERSRSTPGTPLQVSDDVPRGKLILVTGPSASGKTTFANRLSLALRAYGFAPLTISMDEYYRDSHTDPNYPRNPDGTPNHELVQCLRLEDLKEDINTILTYGEVELPQFDMVNSRPKPKTGLHLKSLPKGSNPVVIVEGIFALSPVFVKMLEGEDVTKVFVMPIATTGATELLTFPNQTIRLIRRISRDYLHRGRNARASIARVPVVEKGEDQGIFPLLRNADFVFNTFVDFEVGLLRVYVAPLLRQIEPSDATYKEGQWLLSVLEGIQSVSDRAVGRESLVREFIGGSLFEAEPLPTHFDNRAGQLLGKRFSFSKSIPPAMFHRQAQAAANDHIPCILDALLEQLCKESPIGSGEESEASDVEDVSCEELTPSHPKKSKKDARQGLLGPDELLATLNNRQIVPLHLPLEGSDYFHGAELKPVSVATPAGYAAYDATAILMLHVAVKQTLGMSHRVVVVHQYVEEGDRFCVRVHDRERCIALTMQDREEIMRAMKTLQEDDHKILLRYSSPAAAVELFLRHHMSYSVSLIESSTRPKVLLANLAGIPTLALTPLLPSTKNIEVSSISLTPDSAIDGNEFCEWTFTIGKNHIAKSPALSSPLFEVQRRPISTAVANEVCASRDVMQEAQRLFTVGEVNNAIFSGNAATFVSVDESLEFKKLYEVFNRVVSTDTRVVFVAGSSSSGKTVIAAQLHTMLTAHGYTTSILGTDDYYRNLADEEYPRFPSGEKNCECVDALRLPLLKEHFKKLLLDGEDVTDAPCFDCGKGIILSATKRIRAVPSRRGVLIVEGLFALSPKIHRMLDFGDKGAKPNTLRVMIHPMPVMNLDELHLISATTLRLIRRCVRDYFVRSRTAKETLERRKSVQDGEVLNTLPFIEEADMIVSAVCMYELSSLRSTAEMLLNYVPDSLTDGGDAVRCAMELKEILSWVCGMPESRMPTTKFIRMLVDPMEAEEH